MGYVHLILKGEIKGDRAHLGVETSLGILTIEHKWTLVLTIVIY